MWTFSHRIIFLLIFTILLKSVNKDYLIRFSFTYYKYLASVSDYFVFETNVSHLIRDKRFQGLQQRHEKQILCVDWLA